MTFKEVRESARRTRIESEKRRLKGCGEDTDPLIQEIEHLRDVLKQIYNVASFDYDTMPESLRRDIFAAVLELADKGLNIK